MTGTARLTRIASAPLLPGAVLSFIFDRTSVDETRRNCKSRPPWTDLCRLNGRVSRGRRLEDRTDAPRLNRRWSTIVDAESGVRSGV